MIGVVWLGGWGNKPESATYIYAPHGLQYTQSSGPLGHGVGRDKDPREEKPSSAATGPLLLPEKPCFLLLSISGSAENIL